MSGNEQNIGLAIQPSLNPSYIGPSSVLLNTQTDEGLHRVLVEVLRDIIAKIQEEGTEIDPEDILDRIAAKLPPIDLFHRDILSRKNIPNKIESFLKKNKEFEFVDWSECPKRSNQFQSAAAVYAGPEYAKEKEIFFQTLLINRRSNPASLQ